ncbi:farnesyl-diphosphate farnesyltransferase [Cytobacillus eiseniae]|uniref:Farnesyl-diphosphate farnesyltransferase n=1 Tax=Cytobacillus eiseniae TaxID=762947 RepID=A0ABS4R9Q6_9BACI|nr:farnesyl-diphosphate farnesyltransferase [Cytobacillus eiseniae]
MSETTDLHNEAIEILKATSRTFFIPISLLTSGLKEAVASAYLCMRAIDEIEDHEELPSIVKSDLLQAVSQMLRTPTTEHNFNELFNPYHSKLPEVTLRLSDWVAICPLPIRNKMLEATAVMAEGMANWVTKDWIINDEKDLDDYTYYVAGLVGVMLTDIWEWYDGTNTDKELAIAFGRGLQSVNILRNHTEDAERGVSFYPNGWGFKDMLAYARRNLALADEYIKGIKTETILHFCQIPLALAHGTLNALTDGKEKMSRSEVTETVSRVVGK